ncbi:MAG: hypothetical protein VW877_15030 [Pseudomonadaceae bacterium]
MFPMGRVVLIVCALGLSGCVTDALYRNGATSYQESIDQVLVSADGQWLVVMTGRYHYVFPMPEVLGRTLGADFQPAVQASFASFKVKSLGRVSGTYRLQLTAQASPQQQSAALSAGYQQKQRQVFYEGGLHGKRYPAGDIVAGEDGRYQRLNQRYYVYVTETMSPPALAARTLVTPLAVMADGALVIVSIPLVVVIGADIAINGMPSLHSP